MPTTETYDFLLRTKENGHHCLQGVSGMISRDTSRRGRDTSGPYENSSLEGR